MKNIICIKLIIAMIIYFAFLLLTGVKEKAVSGDGRNHQIYRVVA